VPPLAQCHFRDRDRRGRGLASSPVGFPWRRGGAGELGRPGAQVLEGPGQGMRSGLTGWGTRRLRYPVPPRADHRPASWPLPARGIGLYL